MKSARTMLILAVVVLVVIVLAVWWWKKDTVKLAVTNITPVAVSGSVALTLTVTSSQTSLDATKWKGRTIRVKTTSLGSFKTTVVDASFASGSGSVTTDVVSFAKALTYSANATDSARIYLKM